MRIQKNASVYLVPSGQQFGVWVLEESADIRTTHGDAHQVEGHNHGQRDLQMAPLSCVISRPHST